MPEQHDDLKLPRADLRPNTTGVPMSCLNCGMAFPRRDVSSPIKGELACPSCGGTRIIYQL
ncbi:hypothetical protein [Halomarina rubra]|uniref:Uncharacterized protein n=1 Tax=Halomarina rubra TaxID=2071873 RepID=A0ABD6AX57_9EURY|nr:hypothetical protein [Halomarina rubra]